VAVLSHGYGARRSRPRRVRDGDSPRDVGDEAVELERWLRSAGVDVFTGRPRTVALALAAAGADVVILDGVLASARCALTASLLALDAERPWGVGSCPPVGNLRAAPEVLLSAATDVAWLGSPGGADVTVDPGVELAGRPVHPLPSTLVITRFGREVALGDASSGQRLGVVLGVARPERVLAGLARGGVRPVDTVLLADHASAEAFRRRERGLGAAGVEAWLTTSKCATKLGDSFGGAPLLVMRRCVEVPSALVDALLGRVVAAVGGRACLSAEERAMVPPCSAIA
jgi:tetraacyldisaccharide-1-P 4'-kinase